MIIKGIKYVRYPGTEREWKITSNNGNKKLGYVEFSNFNLLISKNGAGKSRTLHIINELAEFICGRRNIEQSSFSSQEFDFLFENEGEIYRYFLKIKDRKIEDEIYTKDNKELINRQKQKLLNNGVNIFFRHKDEKNAFASLIIDEIAVFPQIKEWGKALRSFLSTDISRRDYYLDNLEKFKNKRVDKIEGNCDISPLLEMKNNKIGKDFLEELKIAINLLGFNITDIILKQNKDDYAFKVQENGKYYIDQRQMSLRLYATLYMFSIVIAARRQGKSLCILIDDFGEGFDYENVHKLIDFVIKKSHSSSIQYFVTTNDQSVMNSIGLKYWSVIEKEDNKSIFYNIYNSKRNFDDFKYTGLNHFDFFCTKFFKNGFEKDDIDDEFEEGSIDNLD